MKNDSGNNSIRVGEFVSIFRRGWIWHVNFQLEHRQYRKTLRTTSMKEARRRALRIEKEILAGLFKPAVKVIRVEEAVHAYLDFLFSDGRAAKTRVKYRKILHRVVDLATCRRACDLRDIDLRFVDAYRHERKAAGAAPKTIHAETVIVKQLVNFGISRRMIATNSLAELKVTRPKATPQLCWTRGEIDQILAAAGEPYRSMLVLLSETGMRLGELKFLTWKDVDLRRGVLHVRPKDDRRPKSGDQPAIPLSPLARPVLESLPRTARWLLTSPASVTYPAGDRQISERRLLEHLKRVLKKLNLPGQLQTFRHSFISHSFNGPFLSTN